MNYKPLGTSLFNMLSLQLGLTHSRQCILFLNIKISIVYSVLLVGVIHQELCEILTITAF
jgi:hypothetical protein